MASVERAMRSDAQHNRSRLLDVARDAFVDSGEISMTALAKRAGVGVGTLYRHFPTRESLVVAVYQQEIQLLADLAPQLLDAHQPADATRLWFERLAEYGRMKYGVAAIIHGATGEGAERDAWDSIVGAIKALLDAGAESGVFKPELEPTDVLWIVTFLWRIPSGPDVVTRAERMLNVVLDGISARR